MRTNSEASKRVRRWCLVAISASALAAFLLQGAASRAQAPVPAPTTGDAKTGASVFMTVGCYTCHGTVGQGGVGPRLAPNPLPMAAFANFVRNGTPGWSLLGGMPAFSTAVLSEKDLVNLRAYLASVPAPPPPKDIPLLNP
jgi:ubiquinol-cytochrome c reductase cytochrome c subunit